MSSPLRTEHLSKLFRHVDALRDLTIEAPEGSVFALVGPNGVGKTTAKLGLTLYDLHAAIDEHCQRLQFPEEVES